MHALRATTEEHNKRGEKQTNHSSQLSPHSGAEFGLAATGIFAMIIDMVSDDGDPHKIRGHNDDGQCPGEEGNEGGEQGAEDS